MRHGDHGHVLLDQLVDLIVVRLALSRVGQRSGGLDLGDEVGEGRAKLLVVVVGEVIIVEVGGVKGSLRPSPAGRRVSGLWMWRR